MTVSKLPRPADADEPRKSHHAPGIDTRRNAGCVVTAAGARAAELDFAAYAYCERVGIDIQPGQMPPESAYLAIGATDHPRIATVERKRSDEQRRLARGRAAMQRYRERHKVGDTNSGKAVRWLKVGE